MVHFQASSVAEQNQLESAGAQALTMLKSHTYQQQEYKFRTAHAVAKKDKSFKDYEWMCDLDQRKGLDIGARYSGEKKCREFISFIADWQRDKSLQL